jgi:transposase-like protein
VNCPNCNSQNVRRSLRRGIYQGLIQRLILRAPYRCEACGRRFSAFSIRGHSSSRKHHTLAGWLGIRGKQKSRFTRRLSVAVIVVVFLVLAVWIVLYVAEPRAPMQPVTTP